MSNVGMLISFQDNPGFLAAKCIHIYRSAHQKMRIGRFFLGVVRHRIRLDKIDKKKLVLGVCTSARRPLYRPLGGFYVFFESAAACLLIAETKHVSVKDISWVLPRELFHSSALSDVRVRYLV